MMKITTFIVITILLLTLVTAACQPGAQTETIETPARQATPVLWQISLSSSLAWLSDELGPCTNALTPATALLVHQDVQIDQEIVPEVDIFFTWGEPAHITGYAAVIDQETMAFIVHPDNPIESISINDLKEIYSGAIRRWDEIAGGKDYPAEILPLRHPEGADVQHNFSSILGTDKTTGLAVLVPNPSALKQAIDENPGAIGFLPSSWLDESLHTIQIDGIKEEKLSFPILALTPTTPDEVLSEWLTCLQRRIQD